MINRRFMIVPPALLSGGHAEQLEQTSEDFLRMLLEMANMRVPPHSGFDGLPELLSRLLSLYPLGIAPLDGPLWVVCGNALMRTQLLAIVVP
jgi:hypothetical protein